MKRIKVYGISLVMAGVLMISAFILGGCGTTVEVDQKDSDNPPIESDSIVVGVSQVGSESVWRSANSASIQKVFTTQNGYFLIFDNARQKQENQMKSIRKFISLGVDYIVLSPITEDGWDTILQEAKDAGIPVILMDRKVNVTDRSLYTTWVGSNFYEEGRNAGLWLETYLQMQEKEEEPLNIVVLQGTKGSTSEIGRTNGFQSIASQHGNWNILEQVDAEYTTAKGEEEMRRLLNEYEDIDVLVSQNDDMTFGALTAIHSLGRTTGPHGEITIISFDATKRALELLEQGYINVDVECNPEQANKVSQVIRRMERGEAVEREYYVEEMVFTIDNVEEYLRHRTY